MRRGEYGLLFLLAAVWGLSFVFYRIAVPDLGPALFAELRVAVAGAVIVLYLVLIGRASQSLARFRANWKAFLVLGAFNAAIPFTLIGFGELTLPASYASVLNATVPLFTVLFAAQMLGQVVTLRKVVGIGIGIAGVVVVVGAASLSPSMAVLLAAAAATLASCSYGFGIVYTRRQFPSVGSVDLSMSQQLGAAVVLLPLAAYTTPSAHLTTIALEAVLGIALLCTVFAYLIYFRILQTVGPTQVSTVTFLNPIFGILWGHLLLNEPIGLGLVAGFAIILTGVALVTGGGNPSTPPVPSSVGGEPVGLPKP